MPAREALSWSRQPRYSAELIEALVTGWYTDADTHISTPDSTWAQQRSHAETHGYVDTEDFAEVLDLERALRLMASPLLRGRRDLRTQTEALIASAAISAMLLSALDLRELKEMWPHWNVQRLLQKGYAWLAVYLSGGTIAACETAFRQAQVPRHFERRAS